MTYFLWVVGSAFFGAAFTQIFLAWRSGYEKTIVHLQLAATCMWLSIGLFAVAVATKVGLK